MFHLLIPAVGAALTALGALFAVALSNDVKQRVARWLRENGLQKSALMDAVIYLDRLGTGIRAKVKVVTKTRRSELLTLERTYSIDDIDDPALLAALERHGHAQKSVMTLLSA